jgi:hypothetical protein
LVFLVDLSTGASAFGPDNQLQPAKDILITSDSNSRDQDGVQYAAGSLKKSNYHAVRRDLTAFITYISYIDITLLDLTMLPQG